MPWGPSQLFGIFFCLRYIYNRCRSIEQNLLFTNITLFFKIRRVIREILSIFGTKRSFISVLNSFKIDSLESAHWVTFWIEKSHWLIRVNYIFAALKKTLIKTIEPNRGGIKGGNSWTWTVQLFNLKFKSSILMQVSS